MNRIKELRIENGLSQKQLATNIETTQSNIARWENEINEPSASQLIKLSDFFGCSIDFLVGREDDFGNDLKDNRNFLQDKELPAFIKQYKKLSPTAKKIILETMRSINKNSL